ncbi:MAG: co-chaperone GroES [Candidatus Omnitrophica bacterium]|nr:co-chaperone GroES [Candidatus Omnitrophota bacterium]
MNLKPLGDKVIVEILNAEEKTKGGIVLPDTAKEKPQEGKVIAVGTGKTLSNGKIVTPRVKPGDRIIFGKYSGNEVEVEDHEYLIVNEEDILAIVK